MMHKYKVKVKQDHLEKVATGSPESALAEIIWNALDADANNVDVFFNEGPFGVNEIIISDDGNGIAYSEAENLFEALGDSWKSRQQRTSKGRFLHGKNGEGRFKAFALGRVVQWDIVYKKNNDFMQYTIEGISDSLDEFRQSTEKVSEFKKTGITVRISEISKRFHFLNKDKALGKLTPIFALYLSNYSQINLSIEGTRINPDEIIKDKTKLAFDPIDIDGIEYSIDLEIIEWNGIKDHELWFCNENGFPLDQYNRQIRNIGDIGYSAYLKSAYIQKLQSENLLGLGDLNKPLEQICDLAVKKIKDHFFKRALENGRNQVEKWKEEKVYPYTTEPKTPLEVAERQVFDIIAINVNQNLPDFEQTEKKTKTFQLRMLRQAIERSPEELQLIIGEVLQLPKSKREQLAELLKNTSLSDIISASHLVTNRLKFLTGIEHMLFDTEIKKHFKERSQLHRILAKNTWIFGQEFSLSVDDKSLTEVLRKHLELNGKNIVVDEPVKRIDNSIGIVDLMLSRSIPQNHANELEHLVVELKAPKVLIGQNEITQISYAFAIAEDERFRGLSTKWNFLLISNDLDGYAKIELSQFEDGIIFKTNKDQNITIWVKTWSQLIQENKHKLKFVQEKLNYNIDKEDALEHFRNAYAEYTKGLILETEDEKKTGEPEEALIT